MDAGIRTVADMPSFVHLRPNANRYDWTIPETSVKTADAAAGVN
jgi:hypothetical protein